MNYRSTRGKAPPVGFIEALLQGLAPDGGLYLPERVPGDVYGAHLRRRQDYAELASRVMAPFVDADYTGATFGDLVEDAYGVFDDERVAPLRPLSGDRNEWLLELHHGPTLAFKDVALQLLGRLFTHALRARRTTMTVVGATSGDTGSAAISALADRPGITVVMLHPEGRVTEIQRKQMTTAAALNVHNVAIQGTFDDCQRLVKTMFKDRSFATANRLGAVNSINWARVMAQTVYYVSAALQLDRKGEGRVSFVVPTGNFGNVYAAHVARRMGTPIDRLVIATNRNDILVRTITQGRMTKASVNATLSPSMDIQVASNFERMLAEVVKGPAEVREIMADFDRNGKVKLPGRVHDRIRDLFVAGAAGDDETVEMIRRVYEESGVVLDPHSAVGMAVGRRLLGAGHATPVVYLATAHPAKFPEAVSRAIGHAVEPPARLAEILDAPERYQTLPADEATVKNFVAGVGVKG